MTRACWDCFVQYWDRVTRAKTPQKPPGAGSLLFKYAHNTHLQRKCLCGLRKLLAPKNHSTVHSSNSPRSPLSLGLIRLHQAELVMVSMMHSLDEAVGSEGRANNLYVPVRKYNTYIYISIMNSLVFSSHSHGSTGEYSCCSLDYPLFTGVPG